MRIISFDVGIKNMAYCIFDISDSSSPFIIIDWNVLNLMEKKNEIITCNCSLKSSQAKCGKQAKYQKGENTYCEKHAKMSKYQLPDKINIKKLKVDELLKYCNNHFITNIEHNKKYMMEEINKYHEKNVLEPIKKIKEKTASETDLISIGRSMKKSLDEIKEIEKITHVIIENQISPIANRMKTIQGMLAQYYIMSGSPSNNIEFVSSSNKLKGYDSIINTATENIQSEGNNYRQHKKDSIIICNHYLENNENLNKWKYLLSTPKKDDLADCFLQGIWYLKNKKIIKTTENLKIEMV
jgi:hypothetical protein